MRVKLRDLKPNPFRDMAVDPVDMEQVEVLKKSIEKHDFWGGARARRTPDGIEVACGWTRIMAAIAAGREYGDISVGTVDELPDAEMIRIYATENHTQRGGQGAALAGSVASAIKFIARGLLTGDMSGFPDIWSEKAIECTLGNLQSAKGLGQKAITEFLGDIPGINKNTVKQALANLKSSGIYDRLIGEVRDRIAAEEKVKAEAAAAAEAARKVAVEAAAKAEVERKAAAEQRERERERARVAKEERDAEIAAEREAQKKQRLEAQAKVAAEKALLNERLRVLAEERERERAVEAAKRKAEAEALAEQTKAAREKAKAEKEAAEKAKAAAAAEEKRLRDERKDFDFEGVAKYLKVASHIDLFRELVKAPGVAPYVSRDQHAALAKAIVDSYEADVAAPGKKQRARRGDGLPGWMEMHILTLAVAMQKQKRRITREEEEEADRLDARRQALKKLNLFSASIRSAKSNLLQLLRLAKLGQLNPSDNLAFVTAIHSMIEVVEACQKEGYTNWKQPADWPVQRARGPGLNGRAGKLVRHLDNANDGERHNAADLLHREARAARKTVAQLLGID